MADASAATRNSWPSVYGSRAASALERVATVRSMASSICAMLRSLSSWARRRDSSTTAALPSIRTSSSWLARNSTWEPKKQSRAASALPCRRTG